MENNVLGGQIEVATSLESNEPKVEGPSAGDALPNSVRVLIGSLIERYGLSREHLLSIYDSYARDKAAASQPPPTPAETEPEVRMEEDQDEEMVCCENGGADPGRQEVGKMQSLVRSALESYSSSPVSELGTKRKQFTLEEELRMQPTTFATELLDRDQTKVAHAIKRYMNQYSIPQREVVEKTGLNQSHLSQHFLHGVTMKRAKRIKLYHWFEDDQHLRTGKIQSADGSLSAVLESPRVEGSRRRPRWKWSPISTQILSEAFKKNQFPTREQRLELARVCNDAEITMNNGTVARGPEGDTEGITEQRVNTWFTNRRKGLTTPSPTRGLTPGGATPLLTPSFPPPLLKATPATTPGAPGSYQSDSPFTPSRSSPLSAAALIPTNVQTLVNHIQQAQCSTVTAPPLQQQSPPHVAMPLAIALQPSHPNILSRSPSAVVTSQQQSGVPVPALLSQNQMQAFISQLQGTSLHLPTHNFITLPTGATVVNASSPPPCTMQAISVADSQRLPDAVEPTAVTLTPAQVQTLVSQMHRQKIEGSTPQFQFVAIPGFNINAGEEKTILLAPQEQSTQHS